MNPHLPQPPYTPGQRHVLRLPGGVEMPFRFIPPTPPGGFRMGSRGVDPVEEPIHRVVIDPGFWLGETPVTQEQFAVWTRAEGEKHENGFKGADGCLQPIHPAEDLDWVQAFRYCRWLGEQCCNQLPEGFGMACLPTEAEWEWACRGQAGAETEFHSGDGEAALAEAGWYEGNSGGSTQPVGRIAPNEFGLYDLHGNVWEWCHDVWGKDWDKPHPVYRRSVEGDFDEGRPQRANDYPKKFSALPEDRQHRVDRGGSWGSSPRGCCAALRSGGASGLRYRIQGFRVCLAPGPSFAEASARQTGGKGLGSEAGRGAEDGGRGTNPETPAPGNTETPADPSQESRLPHDFRTE